MRSDRRADPAVVRAADPAVIRATAALGLILALTACTPTVTSTPAPLAAPIASPTPGLPGPTSGPSSAVAIDASLLGVLPASVDGLELIESPEAEAAAIAAPELAAIAIALAAGIAVDTTTGEFVYAVVVRLKPEGMNDRVFRDWRDSFDEGACSQADGITGHAESEIDGRTIYIGTCVGGLRTYHVWLAEPGLLISASAVGEHRLGEALMNGLRPSL